MKVIIPETSPDLNGITPETNPDLSEELINKVKCLQLNDLNDQATLSEERLEAQINERGHDRNQDRERHDCPYTRNLPVRSSNYELLPSPPITEARSKDLWNNYFLLSGGRIETPSFPPSPIANDSFTHMRQNSNVEIDKTLEAGNEEYAYLKIREKICENEEIKPIPSDESSNQSVPDDIIDFLLECEEKIENVPAISPNSSVPETCNNVVQISPTCTNVLYVHVYNPPSMTQNKKPLKIFPKADPENHVQNEMPLPCKKKCSPEEKTHYQRFHRIAREFGLGTRDDCNRNFLHIYIMNKKDNFAVYFVTKLRNCFQRGHTSTLTGIQSVSSFINSCDKSGQTPLYYAALYNQPKIMECLLNFGADPNVAETQNGNSPLHTASERGKRYLGVVKLICQSPNVDMNICTKKGRSALHVAVQSHGIPHADGPEKICEVIDSGPIIEHLLHNNAHLTMQDQDGKTALHLAVERCEPDLIRILESNAKDWQEAVNMMDKKGSTALHIAALLETEETMQSSIILGLIARNAKTTIRDSLGRLPAELVSPERKDIADLLKREWSQESFQYVPVDI